MVKYVVWLLPLALALLWWSRRSNNRRRAGR